MRKSFALALPALLIAGSAWAAASDETRADVQNLAGAAAPAQAAAAPSPCAGCAGHDCANCPLALAAAAQAATGTAQPPAPIRCNVD
ncbi:hypothetical protein FM996_13525 [Methylosinus sporium]|uniref:Uncharacterized protein n=2 Tax=Methylosinus TaxID=425 RepID=A0A549SPH9_METSR|nr:MULTISPECIES: hypothetical protein [Methylosinus]MBU3890869.1 hypothetical protein [Methylosinus sp. KRF6]TRL31524.1 hypothetical protein FM996_13525 [Methylosinus sporium]